MDERWQRQWARWRRLLVRREQIGTGRSIALAVICVTLAAAARGIGGLFGPLLPFPTFFPAVLVAALIGGPFAGLLSVVLSLLVVWVAFIEPAFGMTTPGPGLVADFALFTASGVVIVWLASLHRELVFNLEENERARSMLAREIQHRSANMLLVMTSLVRQSVADPDVAVTLIDRMRMAAKTENLLDPSHASVPARIAELLEDTVRRPYGAHVALSGPDIRLDRAQAHALRLMFHEMATNAAKYGALSDSNGRVSIEWWSAGNRLTIVWRESGGPAVDPPSRIGFGSKLIRTMLDEIEATLDADYAAAGYIYTITLKIADDVAAPPERATGPA